MLLDVIVIAKIAIKFRLILLRDLIETRLLNNLIVVLENSRVNYKIKDASLIIVGQGC